MCFLMNELVEEFLVRDEDKKKSSNFPVVHIFFKSQKDPYYIQLSIY